LSYLADAQTYKQTNKVWQKHYLFGEDRKKNKKGGKKEEFGVTWRMLLPGAEKRLTLLDEDETRLERLE